MVAGLEVLQVYALRILTLAASFLAVSLAFFMISELPAKTAVGVGVLAATGVHWLFDRFEERARAKRKAESTDLGQALKDIRRAGPDPKRPD
jgi:hypothetical protein